MNDKVYLIYAAMVLIVLLPWIIILGCVGWTALASMICWEHYGDAHMGVEGTKWLLNKCG